MRSSFMVGPLTRRAKLTHIDIVVAAPGDVGRVPRGRLQVKVLELDFQGAALGSLDRPPARWSKLRRQFPHPR